MIIFDDIERLYKGPASYAESHFAYMNRSARESFCKCREIMEKWFSNYPDEDKKDVRNRLRSNGSNQFFAAFFELYIHALLKSLGYTIVVHPIIQSSGKHPDFLVRSESGEEFYVEAVIASDASEKEGAEHARMNILYNVINGLDSPNFFIGIEIRGAPNTPPPSTRIRSSVDLWLKTLNVDSVLNAIECDDNRLLPRLSFNYDGWSIQFFPIPKNPQSRGEKGLRPIGMISPEPKWTEDTGSIKRTLSKKSSKYGMLPIPYVIAINVITFCPDDIDIINALFGSEKIAIKTSDNKYSTAESFRENGFWIGPKGIQNKRVSAVLSCFEVYPWSIHKSRVRLYCNPWARYPYKGDMEKLPIAIVTESGEIKNSPGVPPGELFGLSVDWVYTDCE